MTELLLEKQARRKALWVIGGFLWLVMIAIVSTVGVQSLKEIEKREERCRSLCDPYQYDTALQDEGWSCLCRDSEGGHWVWKERLTGPIP